MMMYSEQPLTVVLTGIQSERSCTSPLRATNANLALTDHARHAFIGNLQDWFCQESTFSDIESM